MPTSNSALIPRVARDGDFPLSNAQARLWFFWHLEPQSGAYGLSRSARLKGRLNEVAVQQSVDALVARHELLRTTFVECADGRGLQHIHAVSSIPLEVIDLGGLSEEDREAEAHRLAAVDASAPFDLTTGPLLRVKLLRLGGEDHILLVTLHRIISDRQSLDILFNEFAVFYAASIQGHEPKLSEQPIQYVDYAVWQQAWLEAGEGDRQLAYWRGKLGDEQPLLELPLDHPRPAEQNGRGAIHLFAIDGDLTGRLRRIGQSRNVSLSVVLLAAFNGLLYRYTGQRDLRVGVPVTNRHRPETKDLIGCFANTLVLRTELDGHWSFTRLIDAVRDTLLEARDHQDLPFEQLVQALQPERSLSHSPLFQVQFNSVSRRVPGELVELSDLLIEGAAEAKTMIRVDLSLDIVETATGNGEQEGLSCGFTYAEDLFDAMTIKRLASHWRHLLEALADAPDRTIGSVDILDADERRQILEEWGCGESVPQSGKCLHELIEAQVREQPDAVAVLYEDQSLTYGELNAKANQLAHHLRELGVGPDVLVGIAVEPSLDMVIGLVGILKAGGAYVPLDPNYPEDRLAYMIENSGIGLLLTQEPLLGAFGWLGREPKPGIGSNPMLFCLDRDWLKVSAYPMEDLPNITNPQNLIYCIYTSGSTGRPKGTDNYHASFVNLVGWYFGESQRIHRKERVILASSLSFDLTQKNVLGTLAAGGTLIVPLGTLMDTDHFVAALTRFKPTRLNCTPSAYHVISKYVTEHTLSLVVLGGEPIDATLAAHLSKQNIDLMNSYGPTECADVAISYLNAAGSEQTDIPLGKPLPNIQIYILDADLNLVPAGVAGELYIAGISLGRGYHGRPDLTAERFIANPFAKETGARMYRTGDLARWRSDGNVDYIGRVDHQVKIRGFRIELGEIEAALLRYEGLREAIVLVRDAAGGKQLIGYVVGADERGDLESHLRNHLKSSLPDYMVPARIVVLEKMPLTVNGKVDRQRLPAPKPLIVSADLATNLSSTQKLLVEIWREVLGLDAVPAEVNFFDLGGNSLQLIAVHAQIESKLQRKFPLVTLFQHSTITDLAHFLDNKGQEVSSSIDAARARALQRSRSLGRFQQKAGRKTP